MPAETKWTSSGTTDVRVSRESELVPVPLPYRKATAR
jgi:hypothetical protein